MQAGTQQGRKEKGLVIKQQNFSPVAADGHKLDLSPASQGSQDWTCPQVSRTWPAPPCAEQRPWQGVGFRAGRWKREEPAGGTSPKTQERNTSKFKASGIKLLPTSQRLASGGEKVASPKGAAPRGRKWRQVSGTAPFAPSFPRPGKSQLPVDSPLPNLGASGPRARSPYLARSADGRWSPDTPW